MPSDFLLGWTAINLKFCMGWAELSSDANNRKQALRRQWFTGVEGGVNQGLLPTSEEESNLFCACQLLNCDEGQGQ
jgi:hypothetical protein